MVFTLFLINLSNLEWRAQVGHVTVPGACCFWCVCGRLPHRLPQLACKILAWGWSVSAFNKTTRTSLNPSLPFTYLHHLEKLHNILSLLFSDLYEMRLMLNIVDNSLIRKMVAMIIWVFFFFFYSCVSPTAFIWAQLMVGNQWFGGLASPTAYEKVLAEKVSFSYFFDQRWTICLWKNQLLSPGTQLQGSIQGGWRLLLASSCFWLSQVASVLGPLQTILIT